MAMVIFWQAMAINHPPHNHPPAEEKDFAFEAACSGLIKDLERLAKQPARMMKREHSQITTVSKASHLPRAGTDVPKSRAARLEDPPSSFQTKSSSLKVKQQVEIISFDFVKDLLRHKKRKKSYLTGRFRMAQATGGNNVKKNLFMKKKVIYV